MGRNYLSTEAIASMQKRIAALEAENARLRAAHVELLRDIASGQQVSIGGIDTHYRTDFSCQWVDEQIAALEGQEAQS